MVLVGFSYVSVLYSSEVRGYALAVFFAFLAFYLLDRYLETRRWPLAVMFSLSVVLGLLRTLTFVSFYLAALIWSAYRLMRSRAGLKPIVVAMVWCHAVPLLFLTALYFVNVRYVVNVGGGFSPSLIHSYGAALAWALGTPSADIMKFLTCVIAVVALQMGNWAAVAGEIGHVCSLPRRDFGVSDPVDPGARLRRGLHPVFPDRMALLLLLCSLVLSFLYQQGPRGRAICVLLLAAYLVVNGCR